MTTPYLLSHLLEQAVDRAAGAPAVRSGDGALSYGELLDEVARLATALRALGVRRGDRVGIYLHKSVRSMVAVHGILRAGAVSVPVDPFAPAHHLATIVDDAGIEVVVSEDRKRRELEQAAAVSGLRGAAGVDGEVGGLTTVGRSELAGMDAGAVPASLGDDAAYLVYTSGSTGRPKGIVHTHRSGLRYAQLAADLYGLRPGDRLTNTAPLHFDISTFDLFAGPSAGACTLVVPEPYLKLPASLSQLAADEQVTIWYSVPFLLTELLHRGALDERDLTSVRWVLFGGEPVAPAVLRRLMPRFPNARFSNVYGPAEVNQCTFHHLDAPPGDDDDVPIGRPWGDTEVEVVDGGGAPVQAGEPGELLVRSATAMRGYWGHDDLTSRAFAQRPASGGGHSRWYATGDVVRQRGDGALVFLGRRDHQVKVRGNRVELESIEAALTDLPTVVHAVATVASADGTETLVAGVVPADRATFDPVESLRSVASRLPPYAVPHRLVVIDDLPTTTSGKLDRRAIRLHLAAELDVKGAHT